MKYLKTPLRYPGGKSRVAPKLIDKFPKDIGEFREPLPWWRISRSPFLSEISSYPCVGK